MTRRSSQRTGLIALFSCLLPLCSLPARANPWIPPGRDGVINFDYRYSVSDKSFPRDAFTGHTEKSTSLYSKKELRITGRQRLAPKWMVFYDLRGADVVKKKKKTTLQSTGPEDQQLGVARVISAHQRSAHALALSVIIPTGSATQNPGLSIGQYGMEADYLYWHGLGGAGTHAGARGYLSLSLGSRFFFSGGAPQFRGLMLMGHRLGKAWSISGRLFLARTLGGNGGFVAGASENNATNYNLLRAGLGLGYTASHDTRLRLLYEQDLAGQGLHEGHRITLGVSHRY